MVIKIAINSEACWAIRCLCTAAIVMTFFALMGIIVWRY
jgi:hypothetical protein